MSPVICRTLNSEYRLHAPTAALADQLRFVAAKPDLPDFDLAPVDVPITRRDGYLVATLPDGSLIEGTVLNLVGALHRLVLADLVTGNPGTPFLHGATIRIAGRRLLVIGHKGCGKSTLALHLAMAGHDVEGDEHVLIRDADVVARPRTLRVKEGSLDLVAGLPAAVAAAPALVNWDGALIRSVSPALLGRPWVIRPGPLNGIVFLDANYGGRSTARRTGTEDAFARLMAEIMLPRTGIAAAAGRVRRLAARLPAFRLLLGDLDTAEWHLRHIAERLT